MAVPLPLSLDLTLTPGTSYAATIRVSTMAGALLGLPGATAELDVFVTPLDPAPLLSVTTTSSASGSLIVGASFAGPAGLAATTGASLGQLGPSPTVSADIPIVSATFASLSALASLPTTTYSLGTVAFVTASEGSYYGWSPLDPSTPNGTTIVAGSGGNWLLYGTVIVTLTASGLAALGGWDRAAWALRATLADGEVVPLVSGRVYVAPAAP